MKPEFITAALLVAVILSVFCRLEALDLARTRPLVLVQLTAAGVAPLVALLVPKELAELVLAVGLWVYLLAEAARWRGRQPLDTLRPRPTQPQQQQQAQGVPARQLRQVRGGAAPVAQPEDRAT